MQERLLELYCQNKRARRDLLCHSVLDRLHEGQHSGANVLPEEDGALELTMVGCQVRYAASPALGAMTRSAASTCKDEGRLECYTAT